jgi:hypothetical protein
MRCSRAEYASAEVSLPRAIPKQRHEKSSEHIPDSNTTQGLWRTRILGQARLSRERVQFCLGLGPRAVASPPVL